MAERSNAGESRGPRRRRPTGLIARLAGTAGLMASVAGLALTPAFSAAGADRSARLSVAATSGGGQAALVAGLTVGASGESHAALGAAAAGGPRGAGGGGWTHHAHCGDQAYPIAVSERLVAGLHVGDSISNLLSGAPEGNRGWLTWTGAMDEPTLARSLTPPGDSITYVDPDDSSDKSLTVGDWVVGRPGSPPKRCGASCVGGAGQRRHRASHLGSRQGEVWTR